MSRILLILLLCLTPCLCRAQPITAEQLLKQMKPGDTIQLVDDKNAARGTGVGGIANGADAKLDQTHATAPSVSTPWGSAMGGSADSSLSAAAAVYQSTAFRWIAGIVGGLALLGGYFVGRQGNLRGAALYVATGAGLIAGTIFFPEWLELGLLAFLAFHLVEYAYQHGLLTGSIASIVTAVHNVGGAFADQFNTAVKGVREANEAPLMNKIAAANGAKSVEV